MNQLPKTITPKRILLVDDEESIREILEHALSMEGFDVETATNGNEALDLARKSQFDLVITDMIMPGMEGIEAIMGLRALDNKLKIIAISGGSFSGTGDYLPLARKLGASEVLHKPFDCQSLLDTVRLVLTPA